MKGTHQHHINESVLNTDSFDKRRFKEIYAMSKQLQKLTHESTLPTFDLLLSDIWASFYKMKPAISVKEVNGYLSVNKFMMEMIMTDKSYVYQRNFTRLNELASVICTIQFGEKVNEWLAEQLEKDEELRKQALKMQLHLGHLREQEYQETDKKSQVDGMRELKDKLQQTLLGNYESFGQAMDKAQQQSKQMEEGLKSLLGGLGAGSADAQLKKVPLRDKLLLAEKFAATKKMKEIARWAGRFKQIARNKQKSKQSASIIRSGVTIGNDIENLLPVELCFYTHPLMKMDFLRRFVEGETMQFEQIAPENLQKGPIVLCLDQSDSMRSFENQSKGFTLALMSIAKKQRRDLCVILFSSSIQVFKYEKGKMSVSELTRLARAYLGGGTNFTLALDQAVQVINESRFKQADIVFITDGEDKVTDSFLEVFNQKKREKAFNVLSLVIGTNRGMVEQFTDRVVEIKDFTSDGSFTAFEV